MTEHADLQAAITALQGRHGDLVAAVRGHPSVAAAANEQVKAMATANKKMTDKTKSLRNAIGGDQRGSLDLDFKNGVYQVGTEGALRGKKFSDIITFTRSSGGGRFNSAGIYEWLGANAPRIDYDPVTKECKGLLIEEQRTNLLTYSSEFGNGAWAKSRLTVVPNAGISPGGEADADLLVETPETGEHALYRFMSLSATGHSSTVYYKAAGVGYVQVVTSATPSGLADTAFINLSTGSVTSSSFGARLAATMLPGGWVKVTYTATNGVISSARNAIYTKLSPDGTATSYQGDGTSGIYIWGAQLEAGSFPTSYIPTTSAQVTRAADVASVDELSPWYRQEEGTLFADIDAKAYGQSEQVAISFGDGAPTGLLIRAARSVSQLYPVGVITTSSGLAALLQGEGGTGKEKLALAYGAVGAVFARAGITGGTGQHLPFTPAKLSIGSSHVANGLLNGHIRHIRYIPARLSNTELQALTNG